MASPLRRTQLYECINTSIRDKDRDVSDESIHEIQRSNLKMAGFCTRPGRVVSVILFAGHVAAGGGFLRVAPNERERGAICYAQQYPVEQPPLAATLLGKVASGAFELGHTNMR